MGWHRPYKERNYAVGQQLLTLRTRTKLTQTELAALVGVNRRSLQNWESGAGYPKEDGLQRLIAVFLAQGVFTPGQEQEEAAQLWAQVSQDAPRPLALFDTAWFAGLLAARPVSHEAAPAPVASTDASAPPLPTGLVTFLATDIEGSTQRWEQAPQAMQQALTRHHAILRQLTALYHGQVLYTAGDSFICVFADAPAALQSALAVQRALLAEPWPEAVAPLRVRMALHSGAATAGPEGYVAEPTLNRLARVLAAGQGGQILLTQAAVDLIGAGWPSGVTRRDLGVQQLRDVTVPIQLWQAQAPDLPTDVSSLRTAPAAAPLVDWGEAIDVPALYGRETELATLEQWVLTDRCRVIALLGLGGIGKTSLAIAFAHQMVPNFDVVLFRSLRNAPPLGPLLDTLIRAVSVHQGISPDGIPNKIARLVQFLRERRCLLVLDNLETIMQAGDHAGGYRVDTADYSQLIQHLGQVTHQSCLLLTSREKPAELGPLEGRTEPVRTLSLGGLAERACQTILEEKDLAVSEADCAALVQLYGGNPLALKLVSESIREIFGSNIGAFLASGDAFFNGVGRLLNEQFGRVNMLEQAVLTWLAVAREPVTLDRLLVDVAGMARRGEVLAALEALRRRSLIERGAGEPIFTLQPVIMEYLTDRLVGEVCQEIVDERPAILCSYALVQATAKDYVRRSQERLIAAPLLEQTIAICGGGAAAEQQFLDLLEAWRGQPASEQGYGPGNIVNLLRLLRGHLQRFDFSHLTIRQAYLQEVEAQDARLVGAHVSESVFAGAFDYSVCVALSADGAYLAAGTASGEVQLWRLADRTPIVTVQAHAGGVYGIALSADGRLIASGSVNGTIKLWAADSGAILAVLQGHRGTVHSLAISTDGQIIASASFDGTVRLWSLADGQHLATLQGHAGLVWAVALSADGQIVASAGFDGTIRLWDAHSSSCLAILKGHGGGIWSVALSANGRLAASGGLDGTVRLWDTSSATCLAVLHGHTDMVWSVALSADGRLVASGAHDGTIRLWDTSTGACLAVLHEHVGGVRGLTLSSSGQIIASTSFDGTIRLWDVEGGRHRSTLRGHTGLVWGVALTPDGRLVASVGIEGIVRLWETQRGRLLTTLRGHTGTVHSVALAADGQLLASGSFDGTIRLWEVASGRHRATLQGHAGLVWSVALSADGQLVASGGEDGTVRLWETQRGRLLTTLTGHSGAVRDVALTADGQLLASGSFDGTIRLWDTAEQRHRATLHGNASLVWSVSLSADGQLVASGGEDGTVRLWDTQSGQLRATLVGHSGAVFRVALSADGRLVASSGMDGTIRLWQVADGTQLLVVQAHTGAVWGMTLSADGRLIAGGGRDGMVGLWETSSGVALHMLRPDRLYERMDITDLTGVTEAQRAALKALGAAEWSDPPAPLL